MLPSDLRAVEAVNWALHACADEASELVAADGLHVEESGAA